MVRDDSARTRGGDAGQAAVEVVIVTLGLVVLLFGPAWWDGGSGVVGVWLQAMRDWYVRFAAALALPV